MELVLEVRRSIVEDETKAGQSLVADAGVFVLQAVEDQCEDFIDVLLDDLCTSFGNHGKEQEASLSVLPFRPLESFIDDLGRCLNGQLVTQLAANLQECLGSD